MIKNYILGLCLTIQKNLKDSRIVKTIQLLINKNKILIQEKMSLISNGLIIVIELFEDISYLGMINLLYIKSWFLNKVSDLICSYYHVIIYKSRLHILDYILIYVFIITSSNLIYYYSFVIIILVLVDCCVYSDQFKEFYLKVFIYSNCSEIYKPIIGNSGEAVIAKVAAGAIKGATAKGAVAMVGATGLALYADHMVHECGIVDAYKYSNLIQAGLDKQDAVNQIGKSQSIIKQYFSSGTPK